MAQAANGDGIPDFTNPGRPKGTIKFKIDGEVFEALPAVGALFINSVLDEQMDFQLTMASVQPYLDANGQVRQDLDVDPEELTGAATKIKAQIGKVIGFLDDVLLEDSRKRFAERLRSKTNPIELPQVWDAYHYLVGKYSNRPTMPSNSSTNGHGPTGTSSTDGAPPAV